jgi:hypothetical protein
MKTDSVLEQLWTRFDDKAGTSESRAEVARLIFELAPITPAERKRWNDSDPSTHWTLPTAALAFRVFARILGG